MNNNPKIDSQLYKHKINALAGQATVAMSMGTVAAFIILLVCWGSPVRIQVAGWFMAYFMVYLVRYLLIRRFIKKPPEQRNYAQILRQHLSGAVLNGLLWSGLCIFMLNTLKSYESMYVLLILSGLIAGAVATNIILFRYYFAFVIPAALPVILYLFIDASLQMYMAGGIFSIYLVFITVSAYRLHNLVSASLAYQFDNLQLLDVLEQEKNQINRLYSNLEFDLARRKKAEQQLKVEKQRAEELVKSLLAISTLDGLTGIPNRRHFDSTLAREWNRASRSGTPISLIMCDLDWFKSYNDHYGHQKGDNCLIQVANILQEHARRDDDMAARYGGEEFVVILPATNLENAREIAEQIRLAIRNLGLQHRYSQTDNIVTASFGVATVIPGRDQQSTVLLSEADKALYRAKQGGRDSVVTMMIKAVDPGNNIQVPG